jgi:hypothetical protein
MKMKRFSPLAAVRRSSIMFPALPMRLALAAAISLLTAIRAREYYAFAMRDNRYRIIRE